MLSTPTIYGAEREIYYLQYLRPKVQVYHKIALDKNCWNLFLLSHGDSTFNKR